jgi:hypothetical protein
VPFLVFAVEPFYNKLFNLAKGGTPMKKITKKVYEKELRKLQIELVKLQR